MLILSINIHSRQLARTKSLQREPHQAMAGVTASRSPAAEDLVVCIGGNQRASPAGEAFTNKQLLESAIKLQVN